jgi:hypothetical protein
MDTPFKTHAFDDEVSTLNDHLSWQIADEERS